MAILSAEAEYISVFDVAKKALYLSALLKELNYNEGNIKPVILRINNQLVIAMSKNNVFHPRTKHIRLRYYYVRELMLKGVIREDWVDIKR